MHMDDCSTNDFKKSMILDFMGGIRLRIMRVIDEVCIKFKKWLEILVTRTIGVINPYFLSF